MNNNSTEEFEVCTFDSNDATAECVEGGLTFEAAVLMAQRMWNKGKYFGVEVISQSSDTLTPIKWINGNYV